MDVSEENNEEGTEIGKKRGAATTKENLTAKRLALMKSKEDKEVKNIFQTVTKFVTVCLAYNNKLSDSRAYRFPHSDDLYA